MAQLLLKFLQTGSAIVTSRLHLQPCLEYFRLNFGVWTTQRGHLGVDSSKLEETGARPQLVDVTLTQEVSRSNNGSNTNLINKRIRSPNISPFPNFVQTTPTETCTYNQYSSNSNGNQDSELYPFVKSSFPTHVSSKNNSTYTNSNNARTFFVASSGNVSSLNQANAYASQQYSSTDFLSGSNSNINFNSGNTAFLGNTTNVNFNQQYCVGSLKEPRGVGAKDSASTKTTASTGTFLNSSYASVDSVLSGKCSKNLQSLNKNNKFERETGSASSACGPFLGNYATRWESYSTKTNGNPELDRKDCQTIAKMSGGPPHHPHGRQAPSPNTAWNHLQVPNYYPRQPQHAHMSNEHPLLHQPTWHTPTTEPVKSVVSHSHLFNLEQMISDRPYPRHSPGVDLTLQRNGSQNGELPTTPISLSVRDANKINSLPASAIDIQAVELTKSLSPGLKSVSPGLKSIGSGIKPASPILKSITPMSPGIKPPISPGISTSPGIHEKQESPKSIKRPTKRMDSIIERLNPIADKGEKNEKSIGISVISEKLIATDHDKWQVVSQLDKHIQEQAEKEKSSCQSSVIVQASTTNTSHDENSNSSSVLNAPTPTTRDEDVTSPFSNEDSMDSSKSRRKRKPAKTIRVSKDTERIIEMEKQITIVDPVKEINVENQLVEVKIKPEVPVVRRRSGSAPPGSPTLPPRSRRKTSSESETIANIAAMVEKTACSKLPTEENSSSNVDTTTDENAIESLIVETSSKPISVSVIKTKEIVVKDECSESDAPSNDIQSEISGNPVTVVHTPAQKKVTDANSFVEVENKLEEMFAGIADDILEPPKLEKITLDYSEDSKSLGLEENKHEDALLKLVDDGGASTSQFNDSVTSTSNDQSLQKRGRPKANKSRRSSESTSMEVSPKRKKGNKKSKACSEGSPGKSKTVSKKSKGKNSISNKQLTKVDIIKDVYAYDSGSNASSSKSRGPFVQIRGSRDSPISVSIVNTPTNDEDSDKKSYKSKKYHDDTEYRHKVRSRGLHCSTLSNKYDAQTRDATWICVFCKRGPHATEPHLSGPSRFNASVIIPPPGDLFGPYIITTDSPEYQRCLDDPYDQQFRSKKVARVVTAAANNKIISKKSKRKHSDSYDSRSSLEGTDNTDIYLGITETKDKVYEVWAHEDCIVWSPGVYLVGPKIVGLEEAVWTSCNVVCNKCRYRGANLCCVKRGCINVMHFGCAAAADWYLDEENYRALCVTHKAP